MEKLYLKIIEKIEAAEPVFTQAGLPAVRYIDLYRGQPQNPARFEFFDLPAIFVQYKIEKNRANIDIHVLTDQNHDTNNLSPNQMNGLDIIRFYELIKDTLTDLEADNTSKLHWRSDEPMDADVVNYHIISFECYYETILYDKNLTEIDITDTEINLTGKLSNEH